MFRYFLILSGALFNALLLGFLTFCTLLFLMFSYYGNDLPSSKEIENYKPATLSRVYDINGNILGVFGQRNRIYTPIEDMPLLVKNAFISAEDKNFYQHLGYDPISLLKAIIDVLRGKNLRGASTITQQVMKNFLLTSERTGKRKIKEIILSSRIEKVLTKEQILNVYLNEIYLGRGAYGVTAAAITYFDKKLDELNIGEAAFLAALPKAPSFYHPIRQKERSIQRRNFVIKELYENGFISASDYQLYVKSDLETILGSYPLQNQFSLQKKSSYFNDAIRQSILLKYDKKFLETSGLTIRSTLNEAMQKGAKSALQTELIKFDQGLGVYRGPIASLEEEILSSDELSRLFLHRLKIAPPVEGWHLAFVQKVNSTSIDIKILQAQNKFKNDKLEFKKVRWVKERLATNNKLLKVSRPSQLFQRGDVIFVSWETDEILLNGYWTLKQVPEVQGAFMAMEPNSGKVLAMQGGFSYSLSSFNRALQANRQPGSLFKPFVYLTALENGFNPNSIIVDAPISVKQVDGIWRPQNSSNEWFGVAPLRKGLEYSRNLMTVRLAKEIGMSEVKKYAELFGLYDDMPTFLSYALGAGETTLFRLIAAYSTLANGGLEVEPSFFDLIQDRFGTTVYKHGHLRCLGCRNGPGPDNRKPIFLNMAKRIIDPISIFQINSMLQGVVKRGTASQTVGTMGLPIAGKTGTTNNAKDVWFVGFTPSIVAGCYIGYDTPRTLGRSASGGSICGSVFKSFMEIVFGKHLPINWRRPEGTKVFSVDYDTGEVIEQHNSSELVNNLIKETFRQEQTVNDLSITKAIDGGFGMGEELLYLNRRVNDNKTNETNLRKLFDAINTGEKY